MPAWVGIVGVFVAVALPLVAAVLWVARRAGVFS